MNRELLPDYIFGFIPVLHRKLLRRRPNCVIPRQHMNVLNNINFHDGQPMKFYGEKMFISKPNMTKIVGSLIDDGFVTRGQDKDDRRIITLHMTEKGTAFVEEHFGELKAQIVENTNSLSDEEMQELIDSFETIKRIFDKLDEKQENKED